jgi:hypothetical protein
VRRFLALAACLLWASQAGAASFDGAKASTPVEQIICDDSELSPLDETLAAKGVSVRTSIEADYLAMTATTALWQRNDADCCATAGHVTVHLDLERQRPVIAQITFERGAPAAARDEKPPPADTAAAAGAKAMVTYELDEKSFREGAAANDREALETARTMGPILVRLAFEALCARTELSPKEISRVTKVRIFCSDQADVFSAYLPADKGAGGMLIVRMAWMGAAVPSEAEARPGILCGFVRTLKQCAGWGPQ